MLLGIAIGIGLTLLIIHVIFEMKYATFIQNQGWYYCPWFLMPLSWWVNRKYKKVK